MKRLTPLFAAFVTGLVWCAQGQAHHVLGRPSYNLNEDSNTPPSVQVETQIGDYFVTYMAFPAFPRPDQPGRVNLYAKRMDTGEPYRGEVSFKVRNDAWFKVEEELLGVQPADDNVYRQGFEFRRAGKYIIRAEFEAQGEPYVIDFPLRVGDPAPLGPIGITVALLTVVLVGVNLLQRRRLTRTKIRAAHDRARA
jgi:hypothetical protein